MKSYSAIMVREGTLRKVSYEAIDEVEAREIAKRWDIGFAGETAVEPTIKVAEPEAFSLEDAQRMLGGISRATIYRWLDIGRLQRVRDTRRVLITRRSVTQLALGNN
jgi:hypothetical protein